MLLLCLKYKSAWEAFGSMDCKHGCIFPVHRNQSALCLDLNPDYEGLWHRLVLGFKITCYAVLYLIDMVQVFFTEAFFKIELNFSALPLVTRNVPFHFSYEVYCWRKLALHELILFMF